MFGTMQILVGLFLETMQKLLGEVGNNANIGRLCWKQCKYLKVMLERMGRNVMLETAQILVGSV